MTDTSDRTSFCVRGRSTRCCDRRFGCCRCGRSCTSPTTFSQQALFCFNLPCFFWWPLVRETIRGAWRWTSVCQGLSTPVSHPTLSFNLPSFLQNLLPYSDPKGAFWWFICGHMKNNRLFQARKCQRYSVRVCTRFFEIKNAQ